MNEAITVPSASAAASLGRLVRIDARTIWTHEAHEFTPWLEQHIDQLNEAIGIEIELTGREESVGSFAVDLYGREVRTGHIALIENQLAHTDHGHLGQLLTYAAGKKAGVIVWIAPEFREEHQAALQWLNELTPPEVNFFGVQLEVLDINGQRAANFRTVVEPNTWQKVTSQAGSGITSTPGEQRLRYQWFFGQLLADLKAASPGITAAAKTQPDNWFAFGSGTGGCTFGWSFPRGQRFRVELSIDVGDASKNVAIFEALQEQRDQIEGDFGALEWIKEEHARYKHIAVYYDRPVRITDPDEDLATLRQWAVPTTLRFVQVFRPRLRGISG